jgi:nitroreductase
MNTPPLFLTFCYDSRGLVLPTEREVAYIDVGLGMQNVILMAHAAGVATCVLNWTHAKPSDELSLRNELGIDDHHIIVANMVMGYSLKGAPVPMRSGINDFLYWR